MAALIFRPGGADLFPKLMAVVGMIPLLNKDPPRFPKPLAVDNKEDLKPLRCILPGLICDKRDIGFIQ